ncbi:LOW QUALITY PROTEIN: hypothetical protein RJ641_022454 [Dillenia turbinata]|uniref:Uncharacterized protein n=1 Tax=Dillenia turbinata TaxID=194707 RepID=A0AAN8ULK8_9MAGN
MEKYFCVFAKKAPMGSKHMVVGVKQVKQEGSEEWDESMPLPGGIIEGFAESEFNELFLPAKTKSRIELTVGKVEPENGSCVDQGGVRMIKLWAFIVPERYSKLHRTRFTIRATSNDRHIAVLGDMASNQCVELQEMSRKVVNVEFIGFNRIPVEYEWKIKVDTYLPDKRSTVVSKASRPLQVGPWPGFLKQLLLGLLGKSLNTGKEGTQQNSSASFQNQLVQGISFICIFSVAKGTEADLAGLAQLHFKANETGYLLVISRLEGKSLMPSDVCSEGLISCHEDGEIKELLLFAVDEMDGIHLHIMTWPNQTPVLASRTNGVGMTLRPPNGYFTTP